jgi:hypothetical protein
MRRRPARAAQLKQNLAARERFITGRINPHADQSP